MSSTKRNVLVTGGAGFIGSALCRHLVHTGQYRVINVDKLTYAGNASSLDSISLDPNYRFEQSDINNGPLIARLLHDESIDYVVNLAAETHVDRSIKCPGNFIDTNIVGTFCLLQTVLDYWRTLDASARDRFRFHHVSTDEVFGDAGDGEASTRPTRYRPSSPYSASKAAADHLVMAWHRTYGLPVTISHSSNNYGPYQFPDKLIPLVVLNALDELPLPLYGTGSNVRNWIYVDDHVRALELIVTRGRVGQAYQIGRDDQRSNLEVVQSICRLMDELCPRRQGLRYEELISFVDDRPGHDRRYVIDCRQTEVELGWAPLEPFANGLARTVKWYLQRSDWWRPLRRTTDAWRA